MEVIDRNDPNKLTIKEFILTKEDFPDLDDFTRGFVV